MLHLLPSKLSEYIKVGYTFQWIDFTSNGIIRQFIECKLTCYIITHDNSSNFESLDQKLNWSHFSNLSPYIKSHSAQVRWSNDGVDRSHLQTLNGPHLILINNGCFHFAVLLSFCFHSFFIVHSFLLTFSFCLYLSVVQVACMSTLSLLKIYSLFFTFPEEGISPISICIWTPSD